MRSHFAVSSDARYDCGMATTFIPRLTGIRSIAAASVFFYHGWEAVGLSPNNVVGRGYLGVDLFFLLSGFIIAHTHAAEFRSPTAAAFASFLWKRFARLYPAHVTVL